jgi:hypothetical protein
MTNPSAKRLLLFLPALVLILLYLPAFHIWFRMDDFAWLRMRHDLAERGWIDALFVPRAQGTVRVLSERVFFLVFGDQNLDSTPFRAWVLLTHACNLVLAGLIAARLSGMRLAGVFAGLVWAVHPRMVIPLTWASVYNQVLVSFLMLAATYALIEWVENRRGFGWVWLFYLLGFGALELTVMFPVVAALYVLWTKRELLRPALWLFVPAAVFAGLHAFVIPKTPSPVYKMYFDGALVYNFARYFLWSAGPARLGTSIHPKWGLAGLAIAGAWALAIVAFAALWWWKRNERRPAWLLVWYVLFLAPVLPLKNHVSDYYTMLPAAGLMIASGWMLASAWNAGLAWRAAGCALTGVWIVASVAETRAIEQWFVERTSALRRVVDAVAAVEDRWPGKKVLLAGVDQDLFNTGFQDGAFAVAGLHPPYLTPGSEAGIEAREDLGGIKPFVVTRRDAAAWLAADQAVVLEVSGTPRNVTTQYKQIALALASTEDPSEVKTGAPEQSSFLSGDWYGIEGGYRWMGKRATVRLRAPQQGQKLIIEGYAPAAAVPVTLRISAEGVSLGSILQPAADQPFHYEGEIPNSLAARSSMTVVLEAARTFRTGGDTRELSAIVSLIALR